MQFCVAVKSSSYNEFDFAVLLHYMTIIYSCITLVVSATDNFRRQLYKMPLKIITGTFFKIPLKKVRGIF